MANHSGEIGENFDFTVHDGYISPNYCDVPDGEAEPRISMDIALGDECRDLRINSYLIAEILRSQGVSEEQIANLSINFKYDSNSNDTNADRGYIIEDNQIDIHCANIWSGNSDCSDSKYLSEEIELALFVAYHKKILRKDIAYRGKLALMAIGARIGGAALAFGATDVIINEFDPSGGFYENVIKAIAIYLGYESGRKLTDPYIAKERINKQGPLARKMDAIEAQNTPLAKVVYAT